MRELFLALACACATPSTPPHEPVQARSENPFDGARLYVDPVWTQHVESAASELAHVPTAVWIDSIAKTSVVARTLDEIAASKDPATVPLFVVYDLPNRDCAAKSSAGELAVEQGGEQRYAREVIDPIAAAFRAHSAQRAIVVVEPDSLANVATNLSNVKCAASERVYRASIAYAVRALSMSNVAVYLDAAHSGWLGWDDNRAKIATIFSEVLAAAGGADKIRGFAINVSGYGAPDGEATYVDKLADSLAKLGITNKGYIIDTSRSGVPNARTKPGNWCNVKNAGLGPRPRARPSPHIDAYVWIKPPGESDGTTDTSSPRYDSNCSSEDAMPGAPEAGTFFSAYFASLVKNASPPLR